MLSGMGFKHVNFGSTFKGKGTTNLNIIVKGNFQDWQDRKIDPGCLNKVTGTYKVPVTIVGVELRLGRQAFGQLDQLRQVEMIMCITI